MKMKNKFSKDANIVNNSKLLKKGINIIFREVIGSIIRSK